MHRRILRRRSAKTLISLMPLGLSSISARSRLRAVPMMTLSYSNAYHLPLLHGVEHNMLPVSAIMNRYDKLKVEVLSAAKSAHEYLPIRTHDLATKYAIEHDHVCEKLVEFHKQQLIRLSAWNEQDNRDKPFGEWPGANYFFADASDSNYKRIRLLVRGAEFLEDRCGSTAQPPEQEHVGDAHADRKFSRMAIDEARKSVSENDGRPHPWVGAVVVKDGKLLSAAHRGEVPGNHAEFVALERNLSDSAVVGATVYTTLEPCTTRNRPKVPCADRLIERRVARVVIGILDPDERIRGRGQRKLSNAGIATSLFPHDLAMEVEELNREFTRFCDQTSHEMRIQTGKSAGASEEQRRFERVRMSGEELHSLFGQWLSSLFGFSLRRLMVMQGKLTYNQCLDLDLKEGKPPFDFGRIELLIDLDFPTLRVTFDRTIDERTKLSKIEAAFKYSYKQGDGDGERFVGPYVEVQKSIEALGGEFQRELLRSLQTLKT
jgi:pyrimidine deaminase RibD-like protein